MSEDFYGNFDWHFELNKNGVYECDVLKSFYIYSQFQQAIQVLNILMWKRKPLKSLTKCYYNFIH